AFQAGSDPGTDADCRPHQSGSEYFEGPDVVESAGVHGARRTDAGLAGRRHLPLCFSDLSAGDAGADAAVEEDRAGGGEPVDIRRYLRTGADRAQPTGWIGNRPTACAASEPASGRRA